MLEQEQFNQLRKMRLEYVTAARKNGFEEGLRKLLAELYPDNAHFIYELLQNAEDAQATVVEFALDTSGLEVRHNGTRKFAIEDVDSITSIGNSTKANDETQIGKFGVGFKAVYAYTTRPEIRSESLAFAIEDLVVPTRIEGRAAPEWTTFNFPFDRNEKPPETAHFEVKAGLEELDDKSLLFLSHIETIRYELVDGTIGSLKRTIGERVVTIRKEVGEESTESHWLRLMGPTSTGQANQALTVGAAFKVEKQRGRESKAKGEARTAAERWTIVPIDRGDVSIYFPAVKESSGLRFHIHAPFASTVARDSVRDEPGNRELVTDISRLIADALPQLCAEGMIDNSFLAALPNPDDWISEMYLQIQNEIVEAFNERPLTPVLGARGQFAPARTLISSPSEFRKGLAPSDLGTLLDFAGIACSATPQWIRESDGRAGKFLSQLATIQFGWDEFCEAVSEACGLGRSWLDWDEDDDDDEYLNKWHSWLESKSNEVLLKLYELIGEGSRLGETDIEWSDVPIVRLRKRGKLSHVLGGETYLPATKSDKNQDRIPVDLAYFSDEEGMTRTSNLAAFYRAVGAVRWGESARIEQILSTYRERKRPIPAANELAAHLEDVRAFIRYAENNLTARRKLSDVPFLLAEQSMGEPIWVTPVDTFIDVPFAETGLGSLYPRTPLYWTDSSPVAAHRKGDYAHDEEPYPLSAIYLDVEGIEEFLGSIGAKVGVSITKANVLDNPLLEWSWRANNRENNHGIRADWTIHRLRAIIQTNNPNLLRLLWEEVVSAPKSKADALYRANGSSQTHSMESQLAQVLKEVPWILTREGDLRLPREISAQDLPNGWTTPSEHSLAHTLDFGLDERQRHENVREAKRILEEQGLPEGVLPLLKDAQDNGLDIESLLKDAIAEHLDSSLAHGASLDPERRASIAAADALLAPEQTSSMRQRKIMDGKWQATTESKSYLRAQYTTDAGDMHCQICSKTLPFKTKEGFWYFEAVRFIIGRKKVHVSNALALCPLCAAYYKYARRTPSDRLLQEMANLHIAPGQGSVEIPIAWEHKKLTIRFTGKHAIDLKAVLEVAGEERTADE